MIWIIIIAAIIGTFIAGAWDLFTTEVPDEVPALMITFGLFFWYIFSSLSDNFALFISLLVGTIVLAFGLILYKKGHWGGADAWLLAAIAYMIPVYNNQIFMIGYIFNLLIIGSLYMVLYVVVLGLKNRYVFKFYKEDLKKNWKIVAGIPTIFAVFVIVMAFASFYFIGYVNMTPLLYVLLLVAGLVFFWRYGVVIEKNVFKKKIQAKDLKIGDVLEDSIWVGLEKEDVAKIRALGDEVVIKEGVRFVPAYAITLIVTLVLGNLFAFIPSLF